MFEGLEDGKFPQCCWVDALILLMELNNFDSDDKATGDDFCLVDSPVGAFAKFGENFDAARTIHETILNGKWDRSRHFKFSR